jgi:hypothetical protein
MEPDRQQLDRHAGCVIAQQYSSAAFVSFRFHCRKEKFGAFQKYRFLFIFTNFLSLKPRNEKLHKFWRVCA